jgi:hypothetical protein
MAQGENADVATLSRMCADTSFRLGVPMRNIIVFPEQMRLTREKCLYNYKRVGEFLSS